MHKNNCLTELPAHHYLLLISQLEAKRVSVLTQPCTLCIIQTCFSLLNTSEWRVGPLTKLVINVTENWLDIVPRRLKRLG